MHICEELQEIIEPADTTVPSIFFLSRLRIQPARTALLANLHLILSVTLHFIIDFPLLDNTHLLSPLTLAF